ncbi:MAG: NADH-quinone oxidoreductase subunit A [Phycisphaeraceae bacterium]|nr:NADH-quinone oxidoreductase subunit A [Phycisphaeraceae bacterium]
MGFQYANVLFGLLFGAAFVVLNISVLNRILAPRGNDPARSTTYECGEPAIGSAWVRFDMRFYTVALVFIIFEVEVAFLFPWAVVYNELVVWGGLFAFIEVAVFVAVLGVGLVYVWMKGDLDWVKSTTSQGPPEPAQTPQAPRVEEEPEAVGSGT